MNEVTMHLTNTPLMKERTPKSLEGAILTPPPRTYYAIAERGYWVRLTPLPHKGGRASA